MIQNRTRRNSVTSAPSSGTRSSRLLVCLALLGLFTAWVMACGSPEPSGPSGWSQFRGPAGLGISSAENLPTAWSEDSANVMWKTRIPGTGNSSPIVSAGKVFLTTSYPGVKRSVRKSVLALNLESGELLWETDIHRGPRGNRHHLNTFAAPTPVAKENHLYAHFGDILAALDFEGNIIWKTPVDPQYVEYSHWGAASSPVLTEEAVIVAQDREETREKPGWLAAFDQKTGKELWRSTWTDTCCSYTTPLVRRRGSQEEIIFVMAGSVRSFDAQTGQVLWRQEHQMDQPVASPVTEGDLLAVFSGAHTKKYGVMLRLSGAGSDTTVETLWKTKKMIPETASPILYQDRLYTITKGGVVVCYAALTGKRLWRLRLPAGGYHASLIAGDGKLYAFSDTGETVVLASSDESQILSTNQLEAGKGASPAVAMDSLLIRTDTSLYRVSNSSP